MLLKRLVDFLASFCGLVVLSPIIIPVLIAVWLQDFHSPFYIAPRAGLNGRVFRMIKIRSMVINADSSGVDSTSANDNRITSLGRFIRRCKLDEVSQLWNVFTGDMSLVGPRPNVLSAVKGYTNEERRLLEIPPGITDISSIIFADEGEILRNSTDPDGDYDRLIRPWKSRFGLFYRDHQSFILDMTLVMLTVVAIFSRERALQGVQKLLTELGADPDLLRVARRDCPLPMVAPPGAVKDESAPPPADKARAI